MRVTAAGSQPGPGISARMSLSRPLGGHHFGFLRRFQERKRFARSNGIVSKQMPRVGIGLKKVYQSLKTGYTLPAKYRFLRAPSTEKAAPDAWRSLDMNLPGREPAGGSYTPAPSAPLILQGPPALPSMSTGQVIPRIEDDPAFRGGAKKSAAQASARKPAPAPNHRLYRRVEEITPKGAEPSPSAPSEPPVSTGRSTVQREPETAAPAAFERPPSGEAQREPEASQQPGKPAPHAPVETPMPRRPRPQSQTVTPPAPGRMDSRPAPRPDSQSSKIVRREIAPQPPSETPAPRRMAARVAEPPPAQTRAPVPSQPERINPAVSRPATVPPVPERPVPETRQPESTQPPQTTAVVQRAAAPDEPAPQAQPPAHPTPAPTHRPDAVRTVRREPATPEPSPVAPKPEAQPASPPSSTPKAPRAPEIPASENVRLPLEVRRINRPDARPQEGIVQREQDAPLPTEPRERREEAPAAPETSTPQAETTLPASAPAAAPRQTAPPAQQPPSAPARTVQRIAAIPARKPSQARKPRPLTGAPPPIAPEMPVFLPTKTDEQPALPVNQAVVLPEPSVESRPPEQRLLESARIATRQTIRRAPGKQIERVLRRSSGQGQVQREPAQASMETRGGQPGIPERALALASPVGIQMAQKMKQKYTTQAEPARTAAELPLASASLPGLTPATAAPAQPRGDLPGQIFTRLASQPAPHTESPVEAGVVQRAVEQEDAPPQGVTATAPQTEENRPEPTLDLNSVAEQVYPVILRKLAEEKRRSGR